MKINTLQKGINIIKMADGTTRKVVIKLQITAIYLVSSTSGKMYSNSETSPRSVNVIYTINGMKINTLQKGINIIKMADRCVYETGTKEETFSKIYAGIQVVNSGHTGFSYYLNRSMPTTGDVYKRQHCRSITSM